MLKMESRKNQKTAKDNAKKATKVIAVPCQSSPAVTLALKPAFWEALLLSDNWKFWNEKSYKNVMPTVGMLRSMGFQKYA